MSQNPMVTENVEERLERLERTTRRYRLVLAGIGTVVLVCAVIWVVLGGVGRVQAQQSAKAGKVIRANKFILEDENGKVRAELTMDKGGPILELGNENGKVRAELFTDSSGRPWLALYNKYGNCIRLTISKDGTALDLFDESGSLLWSAP